MFVFHSILGIVNADIDDEIALNTIKLFAKNGMSVNNLNRKNSEKNSVILMEKPLAKRYNIWMKLSSVFRMDLDWRQGV